MHTDKVIGLYFVVVPAFDNAGIYGRDVSLTETLELLPIAAEHFHEITTLIWDESKLTGCYAFNHCAFLLVVASYDQRE